MNLQIIVTDATVGASAHAMLWLDNAQLNAGATLWPYAANRFNKAPAQVQFSGLAGDVAAPCQLAVGTSPAGAGLAAGATLSLFAGRRALAGFGAQLVTGALCSGADGVNQLITPDSTAWSGMQTSFKGASANYEPFYTTGATADYLGVYHLVARLRMHDTPSTSQSIQALGYVLQSPWLGNASKTDRLGVFQGALLYPFTGTTWQVVDAGQVALPAFPLAAAADPAQIDVTAAALAPVSTTQLDSDWGALLPVDGEVLAATFQNNTGGATLSGWIWSYFDGMALHGAGATSATWSLEAAAQPNLAHAGGGPGLAAQPAPALISVGDGAPLADPTIATSAATGVNQWVVIATDASATPLPIAVTLTYAPLYLTAR